MSGFLIYFFHWPGTSEKRRVPSYTDRILWRSKEHSEDSVKPLFYRSAMDLTLSDHKPVSAMFKLKVNPTYLCISVPFPAFDDFGTMI